MAPNIRFLTGDIYHDNPERTFGLPIELDAAERYIRNHTNTKDEIVVDVFIQSDGFRYVAKGKLVNLAFASSDLIPLLFKR